MDSHMMRRRLVHTLGSVFGLIIFSGALWVLYHELKAYHLEDIAGHLRGLPAPRLFSALGLTILNYLIMTAYDILALHYIQHPLFYGKTALASFIGYAFSNNMGFGMLAGGSVRYRLYSAWGLSALEITKVVGFCTLTLWLGFFTLGGVIFLLEPLAVPKVVRLPFASVYPLGVIFLAVVAAYFLWSALRRRPLRIREWEFHPPSTHILLAQIAVAVLDWSLAGSVLYCLLPSAPNLSYPGFLGIYMLAQTAGMISQVPGGLGIFEAMVLLLLSSTMPASEIFGALIVYRGIYYILPLCLAVVLLGTQEIVRQQERFHRLAKILGRVSTAVVSDLLALATFVGGAILLFSVATPAVGPRLEWLTDFLPLAVLEISHFLGSLAGMGLLLLARGLQRRLDAAYMLTIVLLVSGIIFSLLKGLDYEEAIVLSVVLAALLLCRGHFYRKASLFSQPFGPGWIAAIVIVLLCSMWLGMFSYKHVEYSRELWWRFTFTDNAPRFLRSMVGISGAALFFAVARLLRPAPPEPRLPGQENIERAGAIVQQSTRTYSNLALLGDKFFLFNQKGNAFIMYGIEGRSWIAMGDPVGPEEEWAGLFWRFLEICDRYDGWAVFYEVGQAHLHFYLDLGLTLLKLGEEARVPMDTFSLEGHGHKGLRHTNIKLEKSGYSFEVIAPESVAVLLPELKVISDAWLAEKNAREKKFSLGFFEEQYLQRFPVGIARRNGKVIAFANIWQGADKEEISMDLMRYLPEIHNGIMDYLIIQLMLWGKQEGYRWFNLGMGPLSGLNEHALAPVWNRLGAFVFHHSEHFYNFQGLRRYKEKFQPEWESKYLASPGGVALPRICANIASLISGGFRGVISK
jgi:phosphatidylglycerol lysyltransferase